MLRPFVKAHYSWASRGRAGGWALAELAATGTDLSRLRELNSLSIVRALRGYPPSTVTELSARTGLSRPSADVIVQGLVGDGWATVVEPAGSSNVGRPARRYQFRADVGHVLGVDVGGHKILAMIADLDGTVVHTSRLAVDPDADPATRLAAMDAAIGVCVRDAGLLPDDLWAITVGVTGPVDATGRTTLFTPLPGWTSVNPAEHLGARFDAPIRVENDCKLA